MKARSLFATIRLLCTLLLAVAVIAGPCQACFDAPENVSAHECCPSSKNSEQHQHNSSCSDVQMAVEKTKQETQTLDLIAVPLSVGESLLAPQVDLVAAETPLAATFTPPPTTTLRC